MEQNTPSYAPSGTPRSQSALLEVMEEKQISVDGTSYPMAEPYMVMATQNPVESFGTFPLPEAQMDRFFMRVSMGYPSEEEEMQILSRTEHSNPLENIEKAVLHPEDIIRLQGQVESVYVSDAVKRYILQIVAATRKHDALTLGASPRGSIALYKAAKANAFLDGREFVLPDDVKTMAESVLAHRMILSPKGKSRYGDARSVIAEVLSGVPVPMNSEQ